MRFKMLTVIAVTGFLAACGTAPTTQEGGAGGSGSGSTIVAGSQEDLAVNVGDRVHFAFDKYNIDPTAAATLKKQAAWLTANPGVKITVEGHCDERGTREYNQALGERRANAARDYLVSLGVAGDRIDTVSFGKERPQDPASSEMAWAKNRRAVSVVK
jgi:peptidoglycan-associated lipoprotein